MHKSFGKLLLAAGFAACMASTAGALELRGGSGGPPTHPAFTPTYTTFIDKIAELSGGEVTVQHMGLEVANLGNMLSNLQSGVVDVGNVLTLYYFAEFPHNMLVSELATLGTNGRTMSGAVTEYTMTCEPCLAEYTEKGLVYLGSGSTTTYRIISREPIRSMAELQGKRIRSAGAPFTRWAEAMGAVPAEVSFNEEYESIANGLLDATMGPPLNALTGNLYEIAPYITEIDIGTFHSASNFTTRRQAWERMTPQQREWYVEAAAHGVAAHGSGFELGDIRTRETSAEFIEPEQDMVDANAAFAEDAMETAAELGRTRYGIENAEEEVARFAALVEKWTGLVADMDDGEVDAMAALFQEEIFSKIDWETYGQ